MQALVIYESMFGNTHTVAEHIADGLRGTHRVSVVPVSEATQARLAGCDLVVVGGPTHVRGLSRDKTRKDALKQADNPEKGLHLDPDAAGQGLRDWFEKLPQVEGVKAAAFDTRVNMPPLVSGRASKGIAKRLSSHGYHLLVDPESFLVDNKTQLVAGEQDRAQAWGAALAALATS